MSAPTREVPVATATEHVETPTTETTRAAAVAPEEATAPGEPNAAVVEETRVKKDAQPVVVEEEREPVVVAPEEEYRDEEPKKEEPKEEKKEETEDVPEPGTEEEMVRTNHLLHTLYLYGRPWRLRLVRAKLSRPETELELIFLDSLLSHSSWIQPHAGKLGYGPSYAGTSGIADQLKGTEEKIKGKVSIVPLLLVGHRLP